MGIENYRTEIDLLLNQLSIDTFKELADEVTRASFGDMVRQLGGDAGAIWIVDKSKPQELVIAVNVGAQGDSIEGKVTQSLDSGLVSKAYTEKQLVHDEGAFRHPEQSMDVDMQLGQYTAYQMASPFNLFGETIGAATVIQLASTKSANGEWGFSKEAVQSFRTWVPVLQRLLEYSAIIR
jgi:hypothetical protein